MWLGLILSLAAEEPGVIIEPGGEVRPAQPPPAFAPLPRTPLTVDLQAAEVRAVLAMFASAGGQNIVIADGVQGRVTLTIRDVAWEDALAMVLLGAGLQAQRLGDNLMVVSPL